MQIHHGNTGNKEVKTRQDKRNGEATLFHDVYS